jgi:hypothetical protein
MNNTTYTVSNTFETFGIPASEKHSTLEAAERAAEALAETLAQAFYERDGKDAIIPYYSKQGKLGWSNEVKFHEDLSNDSGASADDEDGVAGRLPWSELIKRIRREAIVISTITWS